MQARKFRFAVVFAVLAAVTVGAVLAVEPSFVSDSELSLGGIEIGAEDAAVRRKLGPPLRVTRTGDALDPQVEYEGLTLWMDEAHRVGEMLSVARQHCTPSGICPGMPFAKAEQLYGPAIVADREDGTFMEYLGHESLCWLQMAVSDGVIKSVRVECQP